MSSLPEKLLTPEDEELELKKVRLAALKVQLADRELEVASFLADLRHFETHYLQTVGRHYAILDELNAKIAEARARRNPDSRDARDRAQHARTKAQESARSVGEENSDSPSRGGDPFFAKPIRSERLSELYRQAAKLLHPDLTLDAEERKKRHRLMADLNDAYASADEERIRAIVREWQASPENVHGDGPGAELVRVIRMIAQVEARLKNISAEWNQHRQGELFKLKLAVEEARANGRDQLKELCERLDKDIAQAQEELSRDNNKGTL